MDQFTHSPFLSFHSDSIFGQLLTSTSLSFSCCFLALPGLGSYLFFARIASTPPPFRSSSTCESRAWTRLVLGFDFLGDDEEKDPAAGPKMLPIDPDEGDEPKEVLLNEGEGWYA